MAPKEKKHNDIDKMSPLRESAQSDDEDENENDMPKRSSKKRKPMVISSSEEEDEVISKPSMCKLLFVELRLLIYEKLVQEG